MRLLFPVRWLVDAANGLTRFERVFTLLELRDRPNEALKIITDLRRFWLMSGSHELGLKWLEHFLTGSSDAEAFYTAGRLSRKGEKFSKAAEYFDRFLALAVDPSTRAGALYGKALMLHIFASTRKPFPSPRTLWRFTVTSLKLMGSEAARLGRHLEFERVSVLAQR